MPVLKYLLKRPATEIEPISAEDFKRSVLGSLKWHLATLAVSGVLYLFGALTIRPQLMLVGLGLAALGGLVILFVENYRSATLARLKALYPNAGITSETGFRALGLVPLFIPGLWILYWRMLRQKADPRLTKAPFWLNHHIQLGSLLVICGIQFYLPPGMASDWLGFPAAQYMRKYVAELRGTMRLPETELIATIQEQPFTQRGYNFVLMGSASARLTKKTDRFENYLGYIELFNTVTESQERDSGLLSQANPVSWLSPMPSLVNSLVALDDHVGVLSTHRKLSRQILQSLDQVEQQAQSPEQLARIKALRERLKSSYTYKLAHPLGDGRD